jgi:hypothetical protein
LEDPKSEVGKILWEIINWLIKLLLKSEVNEAWWEEIYLLVEFIVEVKCVRG